MLAMKFFSFDAFCDCGGNSIVRAEIANAHQDSVYTLTLPLM